MESTARILDAITKPTDLHLLSNDELAILCNEIREEIIKTTAQTGGHVGSSLGAVEIIVALHSLLNCPEDKIVFDVGHQAYAHKLLTGRLDRFSTLRQTDGITAFTNPDESEYDVHHSGHASDSLSVALGLAKARDLNGGTNKVVAVIGDASLSGGMAFEALNHIGQEQTPMVVVLNDNKMSISRPVGALVHHLGYMRVSDQYRDARDALQAAMEERGPLARFVLDMGRRSKDSFKQFLFPQATIFESLDIVSTSPIDGHDIAKLRDVLSVVLESDVPVLVHAITKKGKGYAPAENNPEAFHGPAGFNPETGELKKSAGGPPTYTKVFGSALIAEAKADDSICAITAAMQDGTGLEAFAEKYPSRFFDTGITEEHALGFASGLAIGGKKPVVAIYSTFMQRAIDQIIIDNAMQDLNVVLAIDRAGLVGGDGATHNGTLDISYLRMVPHARILVPSDEAELVHALHTALAIPGLVALRYPRGAAEGVPLPESPELLEPGKSRIVRRGSDVAILAFGRMVHSALDAAELLKNQGVSARVVDMRWAKPLDVDAIKAAAKTKLVVTVEEGCIPGGAGEGVLEELSKLGSTVPTITLGLPDEFIEQGDYKEIFASLGLDGAGIASTIQAKLT
ncbi:MAG: 1-deoxy-D-xylulose-5-phosphate synthase [Eggerthellaceae bacterium]|nr:1-deoxy-D-xylulose-5-phosphate synthase [Eggerthellaceae bacterium]